MSTRLPQIRNAQTRPRPAPRKLQCAHAICTQHGSPLPPVPPIFSRLAPPCQEFAGQNSCSRSPLWSIVTAAQRRRTKEKHKVTKLDPKSSALRPRVASTQCSCPLPLLRRRAVGTCATPARHRATQHAFSSRIKLHAEAQMLLSARSAKHTICHGRVSAIRYRRSPSSPDTSKASISTRRRKKRSKKTLRNHLFQLQEF